MDDDLFSWTDGSDYDLSDAYDDSEDNLFSGYGTDSDDYGLSDSDYDLMSPDSGVNPGPSSDSIDYNSLGTPETNASGSSAMGPWGQLFAGAGLQGLGGALDYMGKSKLSDKDLANKIKFMQAEMAEQEKYYQLHGKQLSDAYQGYKQYSNTASSKPNAVAQFGLISPGGPSGYFH